MGFFFISTILIIRRFGLYILSHEHLETQLRRLTNLLLSSTLSSASDITYFPWSVLLRSFPQSSDLTWFVFSFPIIRFGFLWSSYLFIEFPFHLLHRLSYWEWEDVKTLIKASPSGYHQMLNRNFRIQKGLELCFLNSERPLWFLPYCSPDLDSVITKNCLNKLDFNKIKA